MKQTTYIYNKMFYSKCTELFVFICIVSFAQFSTCKENFKRRSRTRRALIYPDVTKMQFIIGSGMPVDLQDEAVALGHILKFSYNAPTNASVYTRPGVTTLRKRRSSFRRWDIYDMLSKAADFHDIGGKSCILRTICEIAESPLDTSSGLFSELLHALFTPTTTIEEIRHHSDNEYYAAHQVGKEIGGKCLHFFPECKVNFVDYFSKYMHNSFE